MAEGTKTKDLTPKTVLTGNEEIAVNDNGQDRKVTTQAIADLGDGGGAQNDDELTIVNPSLKTPSGTATNQGDANIEYTANIQAILDELARLANASASIVANPVLIPITTTEAILDFDEDAPSTDPTILDVDEVNNELNLKVAGRYTYTTSLEIENTSNNTDHSVLVRTRNAANNALLTQRTVDIPSKTTRTDFRAVFYDLAEGEEPLDVIITLEGSNNTNLILNKFETTLSIGGVVGATSDVNVKVSENDTTAGKLSSKQQVGDEFTNEIVNPSGNENLLLKYKGWIYNAVRTFKHIFVSNADADYTITWPNKSGTPALLDDIDATEITLNPSQLEFTKKEQAFDYNQSGAQTLAVTDIGAKPGRLIYGTWLADGNVINKPSGMEDYSGLFVGNSYTPSDGDILDMYFATLRRGGNLLVRLNVINNGGGVAPVFPTIQSATVENADPDALVVVFSEAVNITDTTGLSLNFTTGTPKTLAGGITGDGTNTLTFALSADIEDSDVFTLEATASNNITSVATSNVLQATSQAVTNNVSAISNPGDVSGLQIWFDDSDEITIAHTSGSVTSQTDKSTNSYVREGAATWDQVDTLNIDGSVGVMILKDALGGNNININDDQGEVFVVWDRGPANARAYHTLKESGGTFVFIGSENTGVNSYGENSGGTTLKTSFNTNNVREYEIFNMNCDTVNTELNINGVSQSRTTPDSNGSWMSATGTSTQYGGIPGNNYEYNEREYIYYNRKLTSNERSAILVYLQNKWSL